MLFATCSALFNDQSIWKTRTASSIPDDFFSSLCHTPKYIIPPFSILNCNCQILYLSSLPTHLYSPDLHYSQCHMVSFNHDQFLILFSQAPFPDQFCMQYVGQLQHNQCSQWYKQVLTTQVWSSMILNTTCTRRTDKPRYARVKINKVQCVWFTNK